MTLFTAGMTFFIAWWMAFLVTLPFGVRGIYETGESVSEGVETAAPSRPNLWKKMQAATLIAAVVTLVAWGAIEMELLSFLPGPPNSSV